MAKARFDNNPMGDPRSPLKVTRVGHNQRVFVWMLAERPVGIWLHFLHGSKMVCVGLPDCPGCSSGYRPQWEGFIPATDNAGNVALLAITPVAFEGMKSYAGAKDGFFGMKGVLHREGKRCNSPLVFTGSGWKQPDKLFTQEKIMQMVARIHKVNLDEDGQMVLRD